MCTSKRELAAREAFRRWRKNDDRCLLARAPGRINIIGDHTDYNDGLVLPMILDRAIYVVARPSPTSSYHLRSENFQEQISFHPGEWPNVPHAHWASYMLGMLKELPPPAPLEMLVMGDVPMGAGLGSSAALEMAIGMALEQLRGIPIPALDLARIGQIVEHQYASVQCGIMDQIVSRVGRQGQALYLDCQTLQWEHVPFQNEDVQFLVMDSNVKRHLSNSMYNERYIECQTALENLTALDPDLTSLRHIQSHHVRHLQNSTYRRRLKHVMNENDRVRQAPSAIADSDWIQLGRLMNESHLSLRDDYEVSCEELDLIVSHTQSQPGGLGARMMGGGFGGCSVSLVHKENAQTVAHSIAEIFEERYHHQLKYYMLNSGIEACVQWG